MSRNVKKYLVMLMLLQLISFVLQVALYIAHASSDKPKVRVIKLEKRGEQNGYVQTNSRQH